MKPLLLGLPATLVLLASMGCSSQPGTRRKSIAQAKAAVAPTAPPQPISSAAAAATAPAPEPAQAPPTPKTYLIAAGTPVTIRTLGDANSKSATSGSDFEAALESPLIIEGHALAGQGSRVLGTVASVDQGGRVKGKASLSLTLKSLKLASGATVSLQTNQVTQEAKSDTKKNLVRTGVMTGAGAGIGAIAGGGKGAAIGAGVGAGAGVATNVATRGPAAEIPPETVLTFRVTRDVFVTEKPKS
jgi:hypothetical protein